MGKIHRIKDYEKIAAGEVIERPAAVVKELLENAIDAGASRIEIHVEEAGTRSIKIIDDGAGIEPDEVIFAFERHTTSKIKEFSDVYNLSTLGFRGEALASIKAISRVEIATRTKNNDVGKRVVMEGDAVLEDGPVACPIGTSMTVKKLFFNVPVRLKFLKKDAVEFSHVSDIVTRYALACHDVAIKLFHDGHLVLDAPPSKGDLLNKIVSIYGREHAASMLRVDGSAKEFSLHGYVATPDITRSSRTYSTILVNHRYIYSADVARAIENVYDTRLMKGRYPFYVLFLEINPALIDVNIHPTKREIKFSNEEELLERVETWVRATLDEHVKRVPISIGETSLDDHATKLVMGSDGMPAANQSSDGTLATRARSMKGGKKDHQHKTKNFDDLLNEASERVPVGMLELDEAFDDGLSEATRNEGEGERTIAISTGSAGMTAPAARSQVTKLAGWKPLDVGSAGAGMENIDSGTFKVLPPLQLLSKGVQMGNTYLFFVSVDGDLVIVDQHAASERVEYEKITKKHKVMGIMSQAMLLPKRLDLPPQLLVLVEANQTALRNLGFEIVKEMEGNVPVYKVTRFPFVFHVDVDFQVIEDFLQSMLTLERGTLEDDILKLLACHTAIRAGEPLEKKQIWTLLAELDKCDDPHHCCHGRPTYLIKPTTWLEKEFKRIA